MMDMLSKFGLKIVNLLGDPFLSQTHSYKTQREFSQFSPLSEHLPYECYDEEHSIFINSHSCGFVIESLPLVGGDDTAEKIISGIFQDQLVENASLQFLLWADPRIDPLLSSWQNGCVNGEVFRESAFKRAEFFRKKAISPRLFRFMLSYTLPKEDVNLLKEIQQKLLRSLKSLTYSYLWSPKHLLEALGGLLNPNGSTEVVKRTYDPYQSISSQSMSGNGVEIEHDRLKFIDSDVEFKSFRVIDTPSYWSLSAMQSLIGDVFQDNFRIPCPFFIHYGVHCPPQNKVESKFWRRSQLVENQGKSGYLIRLIPELAGELKECDHIRRALCKGSKFVYTQLSAGIWSSPNHLLQGEQALKGVFKLNQFNLANNTYLHLIHLLSILPMGWSEYFNDLKDLDVLKTTITNECVNFVPIQGEWVGTNTPGMLLAGRRGQMLNWNPFDNQSGNYNCVVVGRSGSGKSVFMQELLMSGLRGGARVYVLDVGRSFEKLCSVVDGQMIEFSSSSDICLNPFSMIRADSEENKETAFSFLKSIIGCMAAPTQGTSDFENALIEKAIHIVWETKGNLATISDISEWLLAQQDERSRNLGIMLTPYTRKGVYAKYFEGTNNVNFSSHMVLIELEELKEKKDLQAVVLQLFIMTIAQEAFLGDRKTPFYICIDEAWDLLRAPQTGIFIETLARRLRKYYGSLVVGTQSIDDFFSTPGAKAAYENSDWMCLLTQKKSSIAALENNQKIKFNSNMLRALESVSTRHGEYSEVFICDGDGNYSIARLLLDKFSQLLYSTKAQDYARFKDLIASGCSTVEAINRML